jgi:hypothetical protein
MLKVPQRVNSKVLKKLRTLNRRYQSMAMVTYKQILNFKSFFSRFLRSYSVGFLKS